MRAVIAPQPARPRRTPSRTLAEGTPIIGDRRPPSPLGFIQPDHWLAEYTTELINVLNVLGWLVELEPQQAALLEKICAGPTITAEELRTAGALELEPEPSRGKRVAMHPELFND